MKKVLTMVRGLPGSGKTRFSNSIFFNSPDAGVLYWPITQVFSADDFFMKDGVYTIDFSKLTEAHIDCQNRTRAGLEAGGNIVVANTFTCRWEMEPYLQIANETDSRVIIVDCYDGGMDNATLAGRNVHGVPESTIALMRERWEHDWRSGNPVSPWLRNKK